MIMDNVKRKDPDAKLDYPFDWRAKTNGHGDSDWLAPDETIESYVITVDAGLTLNSDSESNGVVVAWLSGGEVGKWYKEIGRAHV
jgi:hypothetical protein